VTARVLLPRPQIRWSAGLRILGWIVTVLLAVVGTLTGVAGLGGIVFFFVLLHGMEALFPRHDQPLNRPGLSVDLLWAVVGTWIRLAFTALVLLMVASAFGVDRGADAIDDWDGLFASQLAELPPLVHALLGGILFDFLLYWMHRLFHTVPVLWRFHAIHHSIRVMDWAVGGRNHPVQEVAFSVIPGLVVIGLGFDPLTVAGLALVFVLIMPFIHTNVRWRLWPLRGIVITPEFHHWHHADDSEAWDKNFTAHLPLWDLLFGTYYMPKDKRPVAYGSPDAVPEDFTGQLFYPIVPGRFQASLTHPGVAVKIPGGVVFTPTQPEVIGS
jgi:sterol desaturase/sphingolipid hydroxylase (fatty acid hydroxylase superfamily)